MNVSHKKLDVIRDEKEKQYFTLQKKKDLTKPYREYSSQSGSI